MCPAERTHPPGTDTFGGIYWSPTCLSALSRASPTWPSNLPAVILLTASSAPSSNLSLMSSACSLFRASFTLSSFRNSCAFLVTSSNPLMMHSLVRRPVADVGRLGRSPWRRQSPSVVQKGSKFRLDGGRTRGVDRGSVVVEVDDAGVDIALAGDGRGVSQGIRCLPHGFGDRALPPRLGALRTLPSEAHRCRCRAGEGAEVLRRELAAGALPNIGIDVGCGKRMPLAGLIPKGEQPGTRPAALEPPHHGRQVGVAHG